MISTTIDDSQQEVAEFLSRSPIIPVVTIDDPNSAGPIAEALITARITVVEITLRTPVALQAIKHITTNFPEISVAAGTVINPEHFPQIIDAGATLAVSPGYTDRLIQEARKNGIPYLPGASGISEIMFLRERGFLNQKFYPAEDSGGVKKLSAIHTVIPDVMFCPTGGISIDNLAQYTSLKNVACVGGSWIVSGKLLRAGKWSDITTLASEALSKVS